MTTSQFSTRYLAAVNLLLPVLENKRAKAALQAEKKRAREAAVRKRDRERKKVMKMTAEVFGTVRRAR